MAPLPIRFTELAQLSSLGVDQSAIGFNSCVRIRDPMVLIASRRQLQSNPVESFA
jgi:clathrin heavy chain